MLIFIDGFSTSSMDLSKGESQQSVVSPEDRDMIDKYKIFPNTNTAPLTRTRRSVGNSRTTFYSCRHARLKIGSLPSHSKYTILAYSSMTLRRIDKWLLFQRHFCSFNDKNILQEFNHRAMYGPACCCLVKEKWKIGTHCCGGFIQGWSVSENDT